MNFKAKKKTKQQREKTRRTNRCTRPEWAVRIQREIDGKEASCQAAVARVVCYCQQRGIAAPSEDTGDYCRQYVQFLQQSTTINTFFGLACRTETGRWATPRQ